MNHQRVQILLAWILCVCAGESSSVCVSVYLSVFLVVVGFCSSRRKISLLLVLFPRTQNSVGSQNRL